MREGVRIHHQFGELMRRLALCTTLACCFAAEAYSQEEAETTNEDKTEESASTSRPSNERSTNMEVGLRLRSMSIPNSLVDIWFFNDSADGWAYTAPRPSIVATAYGLEAAFKTEGAMGVFYFDYIDSNLVEGYWDDQDEPPDHLDGDYLKPSKNLGLAAIGADYYQEIAIVKSAKTNGVFGLDFVVGGGLGIAVLTGEIEQWQSTETGSPGYDRYLDGDISDGAKKIPKVLPLLDVNAGLRLSFGDRASIRFEGGLHSMVYWGATTSVMF